MTASRSQRVGLFAAAFVAVLALDQATKAFMRDYLAEAGSVTLIPGVMDLCLVFNEGAAFSLGAGFAWLFVLVALVVAAGCGAYVALGSPSRALSAVLGAVAGGGIGNLVDRVLTGTVTDFFCPTFIDFAVFNVADIALTCGFVLAFILYWREEGAREREELASGALDATSQRGGGQQ